MEGRICMFTGHRELDQRHLRTLSDKVDALLEELIAEGFTEFRAGGAVGFDMLVSLKVLDKKKKYGFVRLHLYLPCKDQEKNWSNRMKSVYGHILENADTVCYAYERYVNGCMQKRNRDMVEGSEVCVCYCSQSKGGSRYTMDHAAKKGLRIINIYQM